MPIPDPSPANPIDVRGLWLAATAGGGSVLLATGLISGAGPFLPALGGILALGALGAMLTDFRRKVAPPLAGVPSVAATGSVLESYTALVNALPDPMLIVAASEPDDLTGRRYVFANDAARELLRVQRPQGLLLTIVRDPFVLEAVDEALFGAVNAEAPFEFGGAQDRTFRVLARPLGEGRDGARLACLVFREETEHLRVERTRADFLANASHELRTPLASLTGFIETLRGHAREDPGARDKFLGIMQSQAERMSRLIDDLLSLSRIELNEHVAPAQQVDLAQAVGEVLEAMAPIARERGMRITADLPPGGGALVVGDRDQIIQVAQNLVENAIKYSPQDGAVDVILEPGLTRDQAAGVGGPDIVRMSLLTPDSGDSRYVALRVRDRGAGIAREHLPRLTERFYRVEGQKSGERSGTGLGLAIVKHVMNRHRGGLSVESKVGEGAVFSAYFPEARRDPGDAGPAIESKLS
jgi:two-component system phosphate regulon sensor histidine kinase PhoR